MRERERERERELVWTYSFLLGRSGISSPEVSSSVMDCTSCNAEAGEYQRRIQRSPASVEVYTSAGVINFFATSADTKSGETPECSADNEAIKLHLRPVLSLLPVSSSLSSSSSFGFCLGFCLTSFLPR